MASDASVQELQRQLQALERSHAALLAKHDDTQNELAFQKKRFESAVQKATEEKEDEITQSDTATSLRTRRCCRSVTAPALILCPFHLRLL